MASLRCAVSVNGRLGVGNILKSALYLIVRSIERRERAEQCSIVKDKLRLIHIEVDAVSAHVKIEAVRCDLSRAGERAVEKLFVRLDLVELLGGTRLVYIVEVALLHPFLILRELLIHCADIFLGRCRVTALCSVDNEGIYAGIVHVLVSVIAEHTRRQIVRADAVLKQIVVIVLVELTAISEVRGAVALVYRLTAHTKSGRTRGLLGERKIPDVNVDLADLDRAACGILDSHCGLIKPGCGVDRGVRL